ncbi:CoA transferase [Polymorphobacter multimanifer]|uniref:Crotonobetainyl-CoA:carnitine CoA-transferase CaiB-like acyl-CoA transferase n=1 Tax=Polymorphobacter multimanifer TaxID=1070431 RepID=A0A841L7B9_9SPHN|nr:CoA transferase [Polymorphobacter multimanifer]MBB6228497.1 crotonobetainyl-CoA:carnitine CoA-transferase CaiB-like acyl-CoA transferase [Polymorphobacter multimanifer]GGI82950.1 CoA transferase [Polymorphobacter multimanifer]
MTLPLSGTRILSLEQYGAGPYGTMFLAQLGAEVIKIEPPRGGDSSRATGPYFLGADDSLFYQSFNLSKRSLTLDLKSEAGQRILHRLVMTADAVTNNARGDQPAALGLDYAALGAMKPGIVCVHASAYGRDNARAAWPGYDYLMQAEAGFMHLTGAPDSPPTRFGLSMVDFITGTMLSTATLAGIIGARSTGLGGDYDINLLDAALHQTSYPAYWYLNQGHDIGRTTASAHPSVVPSQLIATADGHVFIMAQLPKFWERLAELLGLAALVVDPRFAKPAGRLANRAALVAEIEAVTRTRTTAHWIEVLGGKVPVAAVNTLGEALDSPWFAANGMVETIPQSEGPMRVLANPIRKDGARLPNRAAPKLGADTLDILAEIGIGAEEAAALKASGTV